MDLTIEAIEQDLTNAEARAGQPVAAVHLARAHIRTMLLIARPQEVTIREPIAVAAEPTPILRTSLVVPEMPIEFQDDDVDEDFFAEVRKDHR